MKDVLKLIAPKMRKLGFKGSGQNFRREEGDFIFLVNFQGSLGGERFYINLGAQPTFVPAEGYADLKSLKEYECVFRRRVGRDWFWAIPEQDIPELVAEIEKISSEFFGQAQTLRDALAHDGVRELLGKFNSGVANARATLHLARGAQNLGLYEIAIELASHGLTVAGERAVSLISDLRKVVEESSTAIAQPHVSAGTVGAAGQ